MIRAALLFASLVVLAGCGADQSELRAWMDGIRKSTPMTVGKIDEPRRFEPFRYENTTQIDPFSMAKMNALMERTVGARGGLAPDLRRPREVLENFALDQIQLVGHLRRDRATTALFQVDRLVYQARVGNHVGQHFGRITRITDDGVTLKERVQDASGEWVERETVMQLQEKKP